MTVNFRGKLLDLDTPQVMGILNVTPDSFYADSRSQDEAAIRARAAQILAEGGQIIDVGAYSTRPGAAEVSAEEEIRRLDTALTIIREAFPEAVVSIDTFRSEVARRCVNEYSADIINDVSGGHDPQMFEAVAELHVPYILTHSGGVADDAIPSDSVDTANYLPGVCRWLAERLQMVETAGVADVILDPGFGFGKTLEQNYLLMHHLGDLVKLFPDQAVLVGISRKSMIWKLLGTSPAEALNGTTVLNTLALQAGARILRVHDVREAVETVKMVEKLRVENKKLKVN